MNLEELKKEGEAPVWMDEAGLDTLENGYLLPGETPRAMYLRVSKAAASYYRNNEKWEIEFFNAIWNNWLCLASPIISNLGTNRGLPISCNSIHVDDSIYDIFMKDVELAMLSKHGAGVGIYMGDVRGRNAPIKGNGRSDGIIPWIKTYDITTHSVSQGCHDEQTEILTEKGWILFKDLPALGSLKVAQVTENKQIEFVDYYDYIEYHTEEDLFYFTNDLKSIDIMVTGNHNMVIEKRKRLSNKRDKNGKFLDNTKQLTGKLEFVQADKLKLHRDNRMWVACPVSTSGRTQLSALEKLAIAYQADGSTNPSGNSTGSQSGTLIYCFKFSKQRKIDRFTSIINEVGYYYTISVSDNTTTFLVRFPENKKPSKKLSDVFNLIDFTKELADDFINEISLWDGSAAKDREYISFFSIDSENVDFVQSVGVLAGLLTNRKIITEMDGNRQDLHFVGISLQRNTIGGEDIDIQKVSYSGKVYCVSVPSKIIVTRRNGRTAILGNSTRRGASAVYLPIEHSDIEEFINIRRPTGDANRRCLNIHHGICITDDWMRDLLSGNRQKRSLWQDILKNRVETGEPYLFFTDNVNKQNPECYVKNNLSVKTSNICTEIFLHTDPQHSFVCCLSSLNVDRWEEWKDSNLVEIAIRFLDAVLEEYIEKSSDVHGLENSRRSAIKGRAVGVGILGWHSLLQKKRIPFDSLEAMMLNATIFKTIKERAESETKILAEELGEPEWCAGFGRRNTHLLAIAPTVSNSIISGGLSPSIEPWAANIFAQITAKGTFIKRNPELERILEEKNKNNLDVWKSINEQKGSVQHLNFLSSEEKEVFLTAREINQHAIVKQAAQRQKWIDQGQSINLFFNTNSSAKYIHEVHLNAWESGLKSLYYLRSEGVIRGDGAFRSKDECTACEG